MKKIILVALYFFYANLAWSQEAYICMPSAKTGFYFNSSTKSWEQTRFKTGEQKKILKKNSGKWEWQVFGEKFGFSDCSNGGESESQEGFNSSGYIFCEVLGGHMKMNKNSLRYIETYEIGFIDGQDKADNTPLIEIGTCSSL